MQLRNQRCVSKNDRKIKITKQIFNRQLPCFFRVSFQNSLKFDDLQKNAMYKKDKVQSITVFIYLINF